LAATENYDADIEIQDLVNGQKTPMKTKDPTSGFSTSWLPVISPNMRQVAYELDAKRSAIVVMNIDRPGKPQVLINAPENEIYSPAAWSPDGRILVTVNKSDHTYRLGWLSGGIFRELKSLGWRSNDPGFRPSVSPDGSYIAYSALAVPDST